MSIIGKIIFTYATCYFKFGELEIFLKRFNISLMKKIFLNSEKGLNLTGSSNLILDYYSLIEIEILQNSIILKPEQGAILKFLSLKDFPGNLRGNFESRLRGLFSHLDQF